MTSLIGVGLVLPEPLLVVLDLVLGLEGQVVVLDLVPGLEGQVVELHLVLGLELVVVPDLVVHFVPHLALVVLGSFRIT